jgi:predicted transglutaminase-like cysteine proteinase
MWFCKSKKKYKFKEVKGWSPYNPRIREWQKRQLTCMPDMKAQTGSITKADLKKAKKILRQTRKDIKYFDDIDIYGVREHWPTSVQVLTKKKDDCDGFSVACWARLRKAGFPDNRIGMVIVHGHMLACIKINESDFWILDNGFLVWRAKIVKASRFFPKKIRKQVYVPLVGFNLFDQWIYEPVEK